MSLILYKPFLSSVQNEISTTVDPYYDNVVALLSPDATDSIIADKSKHFYSVSNGGGITIDTAHAPDIGKASYVSAGGTNGYLYVPHNADQNLGTNDFTIEALFWDNRASNDTGDNKLVIKGTNSLSVFELKFYKSTGYTASYAPRGYMRGTDNSSQLASGNGTNRLQQFRHIAFVRNGTTLSIYLDYQLAAQTTNVTIGNAISTNPLYFMGVLNGSTTNDMFKGWLGAARITTGIARYTGTSIDPNSAKFLTEGPNEPTDPYWANVIFMQQVTGKQQQLKDESTYTQQFVSGTYNVSQAAYAGQNVGAILTHLTGPLTFTYDQQLGNLEDFTVEGLFALTTNSTSGASLIRLTDANDNVQVELKLTYVSSNSYKLQAVTANGSTIFGSTINPVGVGLHYAITFTRSSNNFIAAGWANGSFMGSSSILNFTAGGSGSKIVYGKINGTANIYSGGIRVTKGVARYTGASTYTVPNNPVVGYFPRKGA